MLRLDDASLILAASDLTDYLACEHLTQQRLGIARGERARPRPVDDPHAELIRARGEQFEDELRQRLEVSHGEIVDLSADEFPRVRAELEAAAARTLEAMRAGAPLIYQAQLFQGRWQGRADFLRRVEAPSAFGAYSYEVLDSKLSRRVKPEYVHQLSLYSRLLAGLQGRMPDTAFLILGDGTEVAVELGRYAALHRRVAARLEQAADGGPIATYPEPVAHCGICGLAAECEARRVQDDHLSLVARISRLQRYRLVELGLPTMTGLATAPEDTDARPIDPEHFDQLHHQADLQVQSRESGDPTHRQLAPQQAMGYAHLPAASPGDTFFDLEGDPYIYEGGIEYLWGWEAAGVYEHIWAHTPDAERVALETFVDQVMMLRAEHPGMHVYHYAPHEVSTLRRLALKYTTRESEIDQFLREGVFVDLYTVVKQALQVGESSYSLKKLDRHHDFVRLETRVREGGGSIVAYENWLSSADSELLEAIRAYNEEDCRSTESLRDWLLGAMRPEAEAEFGVDFDQLRNPPPEDAPAPPPWLADVENLVNRLLEGLPTEPAEDDAGQAERRVLANLLLYHYRESKPQWWRYFDLGALTVEDLLYEREVLSGLQPDPGFPPEPIRSSLGYRFTFPPQEFKLDAGQAEDVTTGATYNVERVADDHVIVTVRANAAPPEPATLAGGLKPVNVVMIRNALVELANTVLANSDGYAAARAILRRDPPRLASGTLGESVEELVSAALGLDRSVLPVQGPPGTGKTYCGARMIVAALQAGLRVGITGPSHAAIQNMLRAIEDHAAEIGHTFSGIYKGDPYVGPHRLVGWTDANGGVNAEHDLVAGTAWLFARPEHRQAFDLLFVDEAAQFAFANAAATALATKNVVLLGDPQQLPQVTQATHPEGAGGSVLDHILNGARTIPPDRGVLLTESWRMHPEICAFVSERSYDGRLHSRPDCANRRIDTTAGGLTGAGLRALAVPHEGRSQASPEEAEAIAAACRELLSGGTVASTDGAVRPLTAADILVVAPYNMARSLIAATVPDGIRVGTVDKFQGQEASVVFYAMTCSAGEDVPRGLDFLFDRNRFNVAVSRAQCLAVLVHSPRLLDADCRTLEVMELVDAVCRFVELADASDLPPYAPDAPVIASA